MRTKGLISVVMCTYNGEEFLEIQLESIVKQTYSNVEIIIIDDHSVDRTWLILTQFKERFPEIKIFRNSLNIGFVENFNKAFSKAKGEYVAFCDQDDIWEPLKLEKLIEHWPLGSPLIYSDSDRFYNKNALPKAKNKLNYRRFEGTDARKISIFNTVSGHAILVERNFAAAVFPIPQQIYYDWSLAVAAAVHGGVSYHDEVLVHQRVHSKNQSIDDSYDHTKRKARTVFDKRIYLHLKFFEGLTIGSANCTHFLRRLRQLWGSSPEDRKKVKLFSFVFMNRDLLFSSKKKLSFISGVKHCVRLTFNI